LEIWDELTIKMLDEREYFENYKQIILKYSEEGIHKIKSKKLFLKEYNI
jgi:protein associated with RNAse G/E